MKLLNKAKKAGRKLKFSIFKTIIPRLEGNTWDFDWTGSRGKKKTNIKGFKSQGQLNQFSQEIQAGVTKLGYGRSEILMQGSATGISFKSKKAFDDGPVSDFDVRIVNSKLLLKAEELGIAKLGHGGSLPLDAKKPERAALLGLRGLQEKMTKRMGREVNLRIYGDKEIAKESGTTQNIKHD